MLLTFKNKFSSLQEHIELSDLIFAATVGVSVGAACALVYMSYKP